ncbi:hypothetical protein [Methylomonas methanica]|uniref:Uncharacterized protein n=1 Tax=Methylomonas methanica (strain DSM 25384 / MC09) TaxID=857087 RepID=G0A5B2_METMM|nr:hypothetical protein [Methylomonas methanica]AEG01618.1 hypothetical protein Metme_3245 [Methylomonas methanica MC09]
MDVVVYILIFQGFLGGFDVLWNHEWKERLPTKSTAAIEQKIHGVRELFYALIFLGLAWFNWNGIWAWVLFSVIVIEIVLTAWDFVIEDKTRILSPVERITHLILSMMGGAYVALLIPVLIEWSHSPSIFICVEYGVRSWILTFLGIGVFGWGVRDLFSGLALTRNQDGQV